jgi:glutamate dehydrogenase/leucine dehydrogenase
MNTLYTLSCQHCACKNVCVIVRNIDKAVASGIEPSRVIISGTGAIKQKIYKLLAEECAEYSYKEWRP